MIETLAVLFLMATTRDPLAGALEAADPPDSVRAAFVVELQDDEALRVLRYDPRYPMEDRWEELAREGQSRELDAAVADWQAQVSPDGRLFPDDLGASMGALVEVEDLGAAWRVHFTHLPSDNDGPLDRWAADHLSAVAWLEPTRDRFIRIEYVAHESFDYPGGGRVTAYEQSYQLDADPEFGFSFITGYRVKVEGSFALASISRDYRVKVRSVDIFFASEAEEKLYLSSLGTEGAPLGGVFAASR